MAIQRFAAQLRQRQPWLMLALGLPIAWAMLGHAVAAPGALAPSASVDRVSALPGGGQPGDLPDMAAISESGAESLRSARPRPASTGSLPPRALPAPPSRTFLSAATDTRLRQALESAHRYPRAPYLLINRGHAPPRA